MDKEFDIHTQAQNRVLLNHKKNEIPCAATWMDLEIIIPKEVNQRKTKIIRYHFKNDTNEPIYKTEANS